ncbi:MAG TPA: hypothetical protein VN765_15635 [Candidatus Acidoferrum sp.]|nr:hypothetical protein [Candidatus Acidoferrum sp.]
MPRKLRLQYPGPVCHALNRGDPGKVQLAAAVRVGTTVPLAWIAERLAGAAAVIWPACRIAGARNLRI